MGLMKPGWARDNLLMYSNYMGNLPDLIYDKLY